MGRFATEALHDAFVFSVADAVMDVSFQGQELLKNPNAKYDLGQTGYSVATGFLAGTAINVATSPFGPLGKMFQSRKDFASGLRAYLGTNTYKGKDLEYLSGNMAEIAKASSFASETMADKETFQYTSFRDPNVPYDLRSQVHDNFVNNIRNLYVISQAFFLFF